MTLQNLLQEVDPKHSAFLVGNGINLYRNYQLDACQSCPQIENGKKVNSKMKKNESWSGILQEYCKKHNIKIDVTNANDLTFPEIACIIDLSSTSIRKKTTGPDAKYEQTVINTKFRHSLAEDLVKLNEQDPVHENFIYYASTKDIPVLTTNMDRLLSNGLEEKKISLTGDLYFKANKYYYWNYCYSNQTTPASNEGKLELVQKFAVWHIHGSADYPDSIKIGLDDYINCTTQAKKMLSSPGKDKIALFATNNENWVGRNTWLDIFFRRNLIILGLSLNSDEVFLRWLFIQRAKYLKMKYPDKDNRPKAWYVHTDPSLNDKSPKGILFKACGIELIHENKYCDIYKCFPPKLE